MKWGKNNKSCEFQNREVPFSEIVFATVAATFTTYGGFANELENPYVVLQEYRDRIQCIGRKCAALGDAEVLLGAVQMVEPALAFDYRIEK